jgi:hypothetical protein
MSEPKAPWRYRWYLFDEPDDDPFDGYDPRDDPSSDDFEPFVDADEPRIDSDWDERDEQ